MGIYLNPGNENFKEYISAPIYVDKTLMIDVVNKFMDESNKYLCVSRPRRFGKTITGDMLTAYYSKGCDSRDLFDRFQIAERDSYQTKLNKYNVIKIDMNSEYQNADDKEVLLKNLSSKIKREIKMEFPEVEIEDNYSLGESILEVYSRTKQTFVIIFDEYDILVREQVSEKLFNEYLGLLNGLFKSSTLRPAISLAYLTGILPIVRDKVQSKLNNFEEYTIIDAGKLAEYIGFTDEEITKLCLKNKLSLDECKLWYDGYRIKNQEVYNPESVVKAITNGEFSGYWSKTSSYEAIADRIRQNFKGTKEDVIKMLSGESVGLNITRFLNTMNSFVTKDDIFTYLIHLGYLAYNKEDKTCYIPNREVRQEWFNAIEGNADYEVTDEIIKSSEELLASTISGDEDSVAKALDISHIHVTSNRSYNNEDALQSAIYLAYIYALNEYTVIKEMTAGKGFADVVYIPVKINAPAMIIELKRNDSADSAIKQIKEKEYFDSLSHYSGDLLFVGINYDEKTKKHSCKIEKMQK